MFKSLVIIHHLFRSGDTDVILDLLCQQDFLKLRKLQSYQWDYYNNSQNILSYSNYLDVRIRCFNNLKHDVIQSHSSSGYSRSSVSYKPRSSIDPTGRPNQLRLLTVEKGLLREVKEVQKLIEALTACRVSASFFKKLHSVYK